MSIYHKHFSHWADQHAKTMISAWKSPDGSPKNKFVCAAGITPSGTVHIGNLREIISVDLVHRALIDQDRQSRFIYSWDDYDAFRKIPANISNKLQLEKYLRLPIVDIPDPGGKAVSYARAHELAAESELSKLGIYPEYIYQHEKYRRGEYADGIRRALEMRHAIRDILNEYRKSPLPENWWPVTVFSSFTGRDRTTVCGWDGTWELRYRCEDSNREECFDLREGGKAGNPGVKLLWRIDWPMRWKFEQVDFEPAGKEHHSAGGSFETAKRISTEVYNNRAPHSFKYDFISIKGMGGKISSSLGNVLSIAQVLEVYQPEVLRYLFAGSRPNAEFKISFDLDVIKIYEDYDRCERTYYGGENVSEKRRLREGRIYELCQIDAATLENAERLFATGHVPVQFSFRHLCNLLLIHNTDVEAAINAFPGASTWLAREKSFRRPALARAYCALHWLQEHAPEEFHFSIRTAEDSPISLSKTEQHVLLAFHTHITAGLFNLNEKELQDKIYFLARTHGLEPQEFFIMLYRVLLGQERGPRLAGFLKTLGQKRVSNILSPYLL